jgi:hypothetical protein
MEIEIGSHLTAVIIVFIASSLIGWIAYLAFKNGQ